MGLQRAAWPIGTQSFAAQGMSEKMHCGAGGPVSTENHWTIVVLLWYSFHNYCIHLDSKKCYWYRETLYVGVGASVCVSCIAYEWLPHCFGIINLIFILFPLLGTTCLNSKKFFKAQIGLLHQCDFLCRKPHFEQNDASTLGSGLVCSIQVDQATSGNLHKSVKIYILCALVGPLGSPFDS